MNVVDYITETFEPRVKFTSLVLTDATIKRMEAVQKALDDAKTRSLHVSWNWHELKKNPVTLDKVVNSVCHVFEQLLAGNVTEVDLGADDELTPRQKEIIDGVKI